MWLILYDFLTILLYCLLISRGFRNLYKLHYYIKGEKFWVKMSWTVAGYLFRLWSHTVYLFIVFPIRILGSCLCTENMTLLHTFASFVCSMTAGLFLLMKFSSTKELWFLPREKSPGLSFYVGGVTFTHEPLPICQKITAEVRLHSHKYMCSLISGVVLLDRGKTLDFLPLIWLTASIVSF